MSRIADPMAVQAEISDLSKRVAELEALYLGHSQEPNLASSVVTLYWDACRNRVFDDSMARHWERQIYGLDVRTLLLMARLVRDPSPWYPFLVITDGFIECDFDLSEVQQHLIGVAQGLLKIQGLGKLRPQDFRGNPLRIKTALSAISRMQEENRSSRIRLYTKRRLEDDLIHTKP